MLEAIQKARRRLVAALLPGGVALANLGTTSKLARRMCVLEDNRERGSVRSPPHVHKLCSWKPAENFRVTS